MTTAIGKPKPGFKKECNCYNCQYSCSAPGSAHKECHHPQAEKLHENPMARIMSMFASVGRIAATPSSVEGINIVLDPWGVSNGWANWPYNFDPVWVHACDGFFDRKFKEL